MNTIKLAIAFSLACGKYRVSHQDRIRLIRKAGSLEAIMPLLNKAGSDPAYQEILLSRAIEEELDKLKGKAYPDDWQVVTILDSLYPRRLLDIHRPPALLFMAGGGLSALNQDLVLGLIGSRRPSAYGIEVTRKLASELADRQVPIVSGGARGIDGLAHASVLERAGVTLAVTACGLDLTYPPEHRSLFEKICKRGGLVTEFCPGTPARKNHFPSRNRILAGLCDAILVTEASRASGTLITAGFAADYGREVLAVPGSILSGFSRSCHELIKEGALLIESADDIPGLSSRNPRGEKRDLGKGETRLQLSLEDREILQALENAPRNLDGLVKATGLGRDQVSLRLVLLQGQGLVLLNRGLYSLSPRAYA